VTDATAQVDTRSRILDAATRLFAAHGFRRVTVRDICREADANVAAVNYHFRDKMQLYVLVVDQAAAAIRDLTAEARREGEGRPPAEQLGAYIRVHCTHLFALGAEDAARIGLLQQLIQREMQDPTPAVERFIDQALAPRFEYLASIVSALLDLPSDHPVVIQSVTSIHAQVLMFRPSPVLDRMAEQLPAVQEAFDVERVIHHILAFSLAGLEAYRAGSARLPPEAQALVRTRRG
jgi:AcrR family transcriptional regulator